MKPFVSNISCEKCKAQSSWYTQFQSCHFVCGKCGAYFIINSDKTPKYQATHNTNKSLPAPTFKCGTSLTFDNVIYTVISVAIKADATYPEFTWTEYSLFNDKSGYLSLSESAGHWMILNELEGVPIKQHRALLYRGRSFELFQRSKSKTIYAVGEFSENPFRKGARYEEYIAPPEMLSYEHIENTSTWFHANYIEPSKIATAAGIKKSSLPRKTGVGAIQPFTSALTIKETNIIVTAVTAIIILIHFIFSARAWEQLCIVKSELYRSVSGQITSPEFTISSTRALRLDYHSDVNGNWSEAEIELFNEETGESIGTVCGAEYYTGYDDGGMWSEGEQQTNTILSAVRPGTYRMIVKPNRGLSNASGSEFSVVLSSTPTITSNMFVCVGVVLAFGLFQYFRRRSFESSRWSNSDFNPYADD